MAQRVVKLLELLVFSSKCSRMVKVLEQENELGLVTRGSVSVW